MKKISWYYIWRCFSQNNTEHKLQSIVENSNVSRLTSPLKSPLTHLFHQELLRTFEIISNYRGAENRFQYIDVATKY